MHFTPIISNRVYVYQIHISSQSKWMLSRLQRIGVYGKWPLDTPQLKNKLFLFPFLHYTASQRLFHAVRKIYLLLLSCFNPCGSMKRGCFFKGIKPANKFLDKEGGTVQNNELNQQRDYLFRETVIKFLKMTWFYSEFNGKV